jgi:energy-coupling factor transport system permease protein
LLKPLLLGALIGVETRTLALESRGFSRPGPRTSTAAVTDPPSARIVQRAVLVAALALIFVAVAW